MSPRWIVVFGRMGISVAVAPRVILRRKTPRAPGSSRQLGERLAVDRLVGHVDVDALDRHVQQLGVLDLLGVRPDHLHEHLARPATATTSPSRSTVSAVASSIVPSCGGCARRRRARRAPGPRPRRPGGRRPSRPVCTRKARSSQRCQAEPAPPISLRAAVLLPRSPCRRRRDRCGAAPVRPARSRSPSRRCRTCRSPRRRSASTSSMALVCSAARPSRLMASVERPIEAEMVCDPAYSPAA